MHCVHMSETVSTAIVTVCMHIVHASLSQVILLCRNVQLGSSGSRQAGSRQSESRQGSDGNAAQHWQTRAGLCDKLTVATRQHMVEEETVQDD